MNRFARVTSVGLLSAAFALAACSERPAAEPPPPSQAPAAQAPAEPPAPAEQAAKERAPAAAEPSQHAEPERAQPPQPTGQPAVEAEAKSKAAGPAASGDAKAAQPAAAGPAASGDAKAAQPAAATPCGEDGQPECPLQAWMDRNLQTPLDDGDLQQVARNLARVPKLVPDPSWNRPGDGWSALAEGGVQAAQRGDTDAVKQSCKSCHKTWRRQYKERFRQRPI